MQFCIISPIRGLNRYSTLGHAHLALAHIENKEYIEFYRQMSERGDTVILDNGTYEDKLQSMENLLERAAEINPDIVVLPDLLLQPAKANLELFGQLLSDWRGALKYELMAVPQAEKGDHKGYFECLDEMISVAEVSNIGIARAVATDIGIPRADVVKYIIDHVSDISIHALGMVDGDVYELEALADAGCDSVDSSAPVWRGWHGFRLDSVLKWPDYPCDFKAGWEPSRLCHSIIMGNLEVCGAFAGDLDLVGRCVRRVWDDRYRALNGPTDGVPELSKQE